MLCIKTHLLLICSIGAVSKLTPFNQDPLTQRNCEIFGVYCEAVSQQVNHLTNESYDTGKGINTVISSLH